MNINASYIHLENILFFAHHGVATQETIVGNEFYINLRLKVDFAHAITTDAVEDTVSYADVYTLLKEEMGIPSKLLEHVCGRIAERLFRDFPAIEEVEIKLSKRNPPMGADIDAAGVEMFCTRAGEIMRKNFTPSLSTFPRLRGGISSAPGRSVLGSGEEAVPRSRECQSKIN